MTKEKNKKKEKNLKKQELKEKLENSKKINEKKEGIKEEIKLNEIKTNKTQEKTDEKTNKKNLKITLIFMLACVFLFLIAYNILKGEQSFIYKGIPFTKYQYSKTLMLYSFPVEINLNKINAKYTFFLRKDPRKIKDNFNGTINLKKYLIINVQEEEPGEFNCDGDGIISLGNIQALYTKMGIEVLSDRESSCENISKNEVLLTIKKGNKTELVQDNEKCYTVYVKDCEILEGTERFIVETVVKLNQLKNG